MNSENNVYVRRKGFYERNIKRPVDFLCALCAIVVLSPIILIIALLVRIKLGTPVIFTQKRPGLNGEVFELYKFRTMTDERDKNGKILHDDNRLTSFGRKLRSTSLDELPEIINILKGDMSIIGPRPLLQRDVEYMNNVQLERHKVRPGLTGFAQCSGRNLLNWDEKLEMDKEYVDYLSFRMDFKVFFLTILKVLKRDGVTFEEGCDMDLKDWNELQKREVDEKKNHEFKNN